MSYQLPQGFSVPASTAGSSGCLTRGSRPGRSPTGRGPPASTRRTWSSPRRWSWTASAPPATESAPWWSTPATPTRARAAGSGRRPPDGPPGRARPAAWRRQQVLVLSTGIIGEFLPMDKIAGASPGGRQAGSDDEPSSLAAARGMMTTDTGPSWPGARSRAGNRWFQITGHGQGRGDDRPQHGHHAGRCADRRCLGCRRRPGRLCRTPSTTASTASASKAT